MMINLSFTVKFDKFCFLSTFKYIIDPLLLISSSESRPKRFFLVVFSSHHDYRKVEQKIILMVFSNDSDDLEIYLHLIPVQIFGRGQ